MNALNVDFGTVTVKDAPAHIPTGGMRVLLKASFPKTKRNLMNGAHGYQRGKKNERSHIS